MSVPPAAAQANSAGHAAMKAGDAAAAQTHFAQAVALAPEVLDFRLNHAIALNTLGRFAEARTELEAVEALGRGNPAYCSTRASSERALGRKREAAEWYDRALAIEPQRVRALHGRARVALERGEADALERFDRALAVNSGDADLWLGKAQALDVAGDAGGAHAIAEQLVAQAPHWTEGLKFLAQLRLGEGEEDFTSHYGTAAERVPQDPNILAEWATQLAGLDYNEQAAEVAARACKAFPQIEHFRLMHAIYSGAAGDDEKAERLFSALEIDSENRWVQEARHSLRLAHYDRADKALTRALELAPLSISAWALRDILWRLTDNPQAEWLHGQEGFVRLLALHDADSVLAPAIAVLHELHETAPMPLGQSLRGGSQTRGILFDREEPELLALRTAIEDTLEEYRQGLPPLDEAHPLLAHRAAPWWISGSWSVRLSGGGHHHAAHIHPQGIVSSALYCELPESLGDDDDRAGWIELGRPARDLRVELEPLYALRPKAGHLALFPSTLYHGTRPFAEGRRMTVAFDVTLAA
ncbi:putative 2OG-Fe(II) oxygenase [Aurantiacibacter sp. MUD11]|uniref:putative 2OG-Fe(II) oxygenase n=1 Tax=Aurantiacibacter sp. MUD11 TaxID=3003265 RepID=UPI0022AA5D0D|nr:putative 2OG-Fe(II) oxygenase [Aurantiacibacter sp. MUD11]WAT18130.1 putative 2OG-Fe(II) oxygenase [Aurantiacibacter sp. MUD11]